MKGTPGYNPRWAPHRQPNSALTQELDGFVEAGMKKDALALARHCFKRKTITPIIFDAALNAILTLADHTKRWRRLIESAYNRLPKRDRPAVRFWIMAVRDACRDHKGVLELTPNRFSGEFALLEVIYSMDAAFAVNNKRSSENLDLAWLASVIKLNILSPKRNCFSALPNTARVNKPGTEPWSRRNWQLVAKRSTARLFLRWWKLMP